MTNRQNTQNPFEGLSNEEKDNLWEQLSKDAKKPLSLKEEEVIKVRSILKSIGLDYHKIAEFFDLTPGAFLNSTARKRYEAGILKCIKYVLKNGRIKS